MKRQLINNLLIKVMYALPYYGSLSISELYRYINLSYKGLYRNINKLESKGLIKTERKGRVRLVYLTDKGREVKKLIVSLVELLDLKSKIRGGFR